MGVAKRRFQEEQCNGSPTERRRERRWVAKILSKKSATALPRKGEGTFYLFLSPTLSFSPTAFHQPVTRGYELQRDFLRRATALPRKGEGGTDAWGRLRRDRLADIAGGVDHYL